MRPYRKETRKDYVGNYTAYLYPDGHVETSPPFRPQSKEDTQRKRRVEITRQKAVKMLAAERSILGVSGQLPPPNLIKQENLGSIPGKIFYTEFSTILHKIETISSSATSFISETASVLRQVGLGGYVVGPRANQNKEYPLPYLPTQQEIDNPKGYSDVRLATRQ